MRQQQRIFVLILFVLASHVSPAQLIPYCLKGKWGFAETSGQVKIPCIYEEVNFFSDDKLAKVKKGGKYGYINQAGQTIVPFQYDECIRIYEIQHGEYTIGILPNPAIFLNNNVDFADRDNNRYIVSKNRKFGILSINGGKYRQLVPYRFSKIQFDPAKKIFYCTEAGRLQYFDMAGKPVKPADIDKIQEITYLSEGPDRAPPRKARLISVNGKQGVVVPGWQNGFDTIIAPVYDEVLPKEFPNDFLGPYEIFGVRLGNNWGFVNSERELILPIEYDSVNCKLSSKRHWLSYQFIFVVQQAGKWGIVARKDTRDKELTAFLTFEYDDISGMNKYMRLQKDNRFRLYDPQKNRLLSQKAYDSITAYVHESQYGFYLFQVKNKQGQSVYLGMNGVEFFAD